MPAKEEYNTMNCFHDDWDAYCSELEKEDDPTDDDFVREEYREDENR